MINKLFRQTWFPLGFQILTLIVFVVLIILGFMANTDDMTFAKVLRNTNLANLIVWSYWWPLIILSAIFLGRIWCTVCPMELLTSLASKIGLKRKPPAFLRSGWVMTLFYVLILFIGIHTLSIHRVPTRMAIYMLVLLAAAVGFGLIYSRNTFCANVCPVGHLLGLYSRLAPMGWRVGDKTVCSECKDKSCVSKKTAYVFQGRSCGVGLRPEKLDDNTECLLCGQCLKACDHNNPGQDGRPNPGWFPRRWFKDVLELKPLSFAQVAFCIVVSGFIVYEVFTEWGTTGELLLWTPTTIETALGISGVWGQGMVMSLTLFVALPLLWWMIPFALFRTVGGRLKLSDYLLRFGIAIIPIMAAAHAIKALLKTTSRIPYWKYVASDPLGINTATSILDNTITLDSTFKVWLDPVLTILFLILMGVGVTLSVLVVRKLIVANHFESRWRSGFLYLLPVLYGGGFSVMLLMWRLMG